MQNIWVGLCLAISLWSASCTKSKASPVRATASISLDRTAVKLGDEVHINVTRPLQGWSGEATIDTYRARLPIDSKNNTVGVTRENGFTTTLPTEICVALKDAAGHDVTVSNPCLQVHVSAPLYQLEPDRESVSSLAGSGRIKVRVPPQKELELGDVPDWITVEKGMKFGDYEVLYKVAENSSFKHRTAAIRIGDATFNLKQWGSPYTSIPYTADFVTAPIPVWELVESELKRGQSHDAPQEWVLDDQPNQNATVQVSRNGPSGKSALIIEKPLPAREPWMTMVWLPGIRTDDGGRYTFSVWLKAEHATPVGLAFGQRTGSHNNCGVLQLADVKEEWKQFTYHFKASGKNCGAENNRFEIQAGQVLGKLQVSDFSLTTQ